jgi:hypothetical protein
MPNKMSRKPPPFAYDGFRLNLRASPIPKVAQFLARNIKALPEKDRAFATSLVAEVHKGFRLSPKQASWLRLLATRAHKGAEVTEPRPAAPTLTPPNAGAHTP